MKQNKTEKSVIQLTSERIEALLTAKNDQLQEINNKINEAQQKKRRAEELMAEATDKLDIEAYNKAKTAKLEADGAIEMYSKRFGILQKNDYVSEKESDDQIDAILEYEQEIKVQFETAVSAHVKALNDLCTAYSNEVDVAERLIERWCYEIHRNYRDRGSNTRNDRPVKVHVLPYLGGDVLSMTESYLRKTSIEKLYKEDSAND